MSFENMGTNHGLRVDTGADGTFGADTADYRRLLRPVPLEGITAEGKYDIIVNNTFNDSTSGRYYIRAAGRNGIDFECVVGTEVVAMSGEVVTETFRDVRVGGHSDPRK